MVGLSCLGLAGRCLCSAACAVARGASRSARRFRPRRLFWLLLLFHAHTGHTHVHTHTRTHTPAQHHRHDAHLTLILYIITGALPLEFKYTTAPRAADEQAERARRRPSDVRTYVVLRKVVRNRT
jgi:hypothetical protein